MWKLSQGNFVRVPVASTSCFGLSCLHVFMQLFAVETPAVASGDYLTLPRPGVSGVGHVHGLRGPVVQRVL